MRVCLLSWMMDEMPENSKVIPAAQFAAHCQDTRLDPRDRGSRIQSCLDLMLILQKYIVYRE